MKGLFIPEITAEMFRNGCLESIEALMAEGEIYDIDYQQPCEDCKVKKDAYIQGYDYGVKDWFKSKSQPCDDCISREDALKAIEEQKKGFYGVERYAIDECHSAVMKLPSVRTSQSDDTTSQCDNDVTTCDTEKEKETNTEKDSDLNSDSEIHEDKRACEKCIHYVTRDSRGVVLCGCDSWECDFEEVKT